MPKTKQQIRKGRPGSTDVEAIIERSRIFAQQTVAKYSKDIEKRNQEEGRRFWCGHE
jgi:hypothetical protein